MQLNDSLTLLIITNHQYRSTSVTNEVASECVMLLAIKSIRAPKDSLILTPNGHLNEASHHHFHPTVSFSLCCYTDIWWLKFRLQFSILGIVKTGSQQLFFLHNVINSDANFIFYT